MSTSLFRAFVLFIWVVLTKVEGCLETSPKASLNQLEGSSVTLSCRLSCAGSLVWLLNGSVVPGTMQQPHLTLDLDPSREGMYECAVSSSNGSLAEHAWVANITVERIIAPVDQYVLIGQSINLICNVALKAAALINWYSSEDPSVNGSSSVSIKAASLRDNHAFICSVAQSMTSVTRTVYLHVLAAPRILRGPSSVIEVISNSSVSACNVSVIFQSRPAENTAILWYKNGNSVPCADNITTLLGALEGTTSLAIPQLVSKEDGGVYTVVVRNNFSGIPLSMRSANVSFELKVKVLPASPVNISIFITNSSFVTATWSVHPRTSDEAPITFTLCLVQSGGVVVSIHNLKGSIRLAELHVMSGVDYILNLTAVNTDGSVSASPVAFSLPHEAPAVSSAAIYRLNIATFLVTLNLAKNGGVDIKTMNISYRLAQEKMDWSTPVLVPAVKTSDHSIRATIEVTQSLAVAGPMEFQVLALNALSFEKSPLVLMEKVELPGPPHITITRSSTNLTINVHLSDIGSLPLVKVVLVVTTLGTCWQLTRAGPYLPGDYIIFTFNELTSHDGYIFTAYTVNYAGPGPSSSNAEYSGSPMVPLWIIMISILGALFTIGLVMMVFIGFIRCIGMKRRHYTISDDSISTSIRMYPPQYSNPVDQSSPCSSDTKSFAGSTSTPSDTSPSDKLIQPECRALHVTVKCSDMNLVDELFSECSSKPTFYYATYV